MGGTSGRVPVNAQIVETPKADHLDRALTERTKELACLTGVRGARDRTRIAYIMLQSFLTPFLTILLAEMLDKSQLALIFLSTKKKSYRLLFFGSLLAFVVVDGVAVLFGSVVATLIPDMIVRIVAGLAFLAFGILSFRTENEEHENKRHSGNTFLNAFLIVFFAEWADKTQLASAAFATQFNPIFVFLGVIAAMAILSLLAIFTGSILAAKINKSLLQKIAGLAFIGIGVYLLFFS